MHTPRSFLLAAAATLALFACSPPANPDACDALHPVSRLDPMTLVGECAPSCEDADCTAGTVCDHWTGRCQPMSDPLPPPGVENGQACTMSGAMSECRSQRCITEVSATTH